MGVKRYQGIDAARRGYSYIYKAVDRQQVKDRAFPAIFKLMNAVFETENYIAGGFARYLLSPRANPDPPDDIDIFCKDERTYSLLLDRLTREFPKMIMEEGSISTSFYEKPSALEGDVATTFRPEISKQGSLDMPYPIQLIKPFPSGDHGFSTRLGGDVLDLLDDFDFAVTKVALISNTRSVEHIAFENAETTKTLFSTSPVTRPLGMLTRASKYSKKGYRLSPNEIAKILLAWDNFSPEVKQKAVKMMENVYKDIPSPPGYNQRVPSWYNSSEKEREEMYNLFLGGY